MSDEAKKYFLIFMPHILKHNDLGLLTTSTSPNTSNVGLLGNLGRETENFIFQNWVIWYSHIGFGGTYG